MITKLAGIALLAGVLLVVGATNAQATTVAINSGAGVPYTQTAGTGCPTPTGASTTITPNPLWVAAPAGSAWISCGSNGGAIGGATISTGGVINFTQTFILPAGPISGGTLLIAADDTTGVLLNGITLATAGGPVGTHCVVSGITCTSLTTLALPAGDLIPGGNVLLFDVHELDGDGTGIVYSGAVSVVPEPGSVLLFGTGLMGLVGMRFNRRRKSGERRAIPA